VGALDRIKKKERALQEDLRRFKRSVLGELLELCTPSQLDKFSMLFGTVDPDAIPMSKVLSAVRIVEATVKKNEDRVLDVIAERH